MQPQAATQVQVLMFFDRLHKNVLEGQKRRLALAINRTGLVTQLEANAAASVIMAMRRRAG